MAQLASNLFDKFGKVRQMRESVVGIERIPDDTLATAREELADYESQVLNFRKSVDKFETAIHDIAAACTEVAATSSAVMGGSGAGGKLGFSAIPSVIGKQQAEMDALKSRTDQLVAMHAGISNRLKDRDRAYFAKLHYEDKVAKMAEKPKSGLLTNLSKFIPQDEDKAGRNDKKLEEATTEWFGLDDQCKKEVTDALSGRSDDTNQLIGLFSKLTGELFRASAEAFGAPVKFKPAPPPATQSASQGPVGKAAAGVAPQQAPQSDFRAMLGLDKNKKPAPTQEQEQDDDSDLHD